MFVDKLWKSSRRFVPVELYPLLAHIYRWRRRNQLKRLNEDDRRYLAKHPSVRVPPVELRYNVVGPCPIQQFLLSGERTVKDIESALKAVDMSLYQIREFLDFGCGCGRLILAMQNRNLKLSITGCDVDERAIGWCQRNLKGTTCVVNNELPPSPFKDGSFDLVWCGSVFINADLDNGKLAALAWEQPFEVFTQMVWHEQRWKFPALRAFLEAAREVFSAASEKASKSESSCPGCGEVTDVGLQDL